MSAMYLESGVASCFLAINNAPGVRQWLLVEKKTFLNHFVHVSAAWKKVNIYTTDLHLSKTKRY